MKKASARTVEDSIIATRTVAKKSFLLIEPNNGINRPKSIIKVTSTAMWAISLFWFFTPLFIAKSKTPPKTGISAVGEGEDDW